MTDHPDWLQSFLFWREQVPRHPKDFKGYVFPRPIAEYEKLVHVNGTCPVCQGLKQVATAGDNMSLIYPKKVFCVCAVLEWIADRYQENKKWETVYNRQADIDVLKPWGDKQAQKDLMDVKAHLKKWVVNPNRWIWIQSASTGTGKTVMMHWIKRQLGSMVTYVSVEQLTQRMFSLLGHNEELEALKRHLRSAPILILDDVGYEHKVAWTANFIGEIVNGRYLRNQTIPTPLVATSNLDIEQLVNSSDLSVKRPASRMADNAIADKFILSQGDYRVGGA